MRIRAGLKKISAPALSFLIPAGIMLAVYVYMGVYPFGSKTLLTIDMTNEYVDYFSAFRDMFTGGGSVFYSFSKLLGGSMVGLFAYYLASPLNVIFFFFDKADFDVAIMLLTLIKIGLCGLAFQIYLRGNFGKAGAAEIAFSIFYALMAYNIIYQLNIMWLDGVICLPLVALGIDRMISGRGPAVYFCFLTLAIITNYYIGFMICIFSLLYFIYRLLLSEGYSMALAKRRYFRSAFVRYLLTSVFAAGTSCFLLVPAVLTLSTGKEHFDIANLRFYPDFNFFSLLSKLVIGSHTYIDVKNGLPEVYCGILVTVLAALYFFDKLVSSREKLLSAAFIGIMLVNFYINTFNKVWHGFNAPAWFPYRYSFVFSFLMIILAYRAVTDLKGVKTRHVFVVCLTLFVVFIVLASYGYQDITAKKIAVSAVLTAAYCGSLVYALRSRQVSGRMLAMMLLPYIICEMAYNSYSMLADYTYASKSYYSDFVKNVSAVVDGIKTSDSGFYRMEKTFTRLNYGSRGNPTVNDPLMFGFSGLSHYSSTDDKKSNYLLQCLGYKNNYNWAYFYRGSTAAANALLGVKYIVTDRPSDDLYSLETLRNGYYVNRNSYALPIGYMVSRDLMKTALNPQNPFTQQNSIYSSMLGGESSGSLSAETPVITLHNLREVKNGSRTRYIRINSSKPASVTYTFSSASGGCDYAYFYTDRFRKVSLKLNGESMGSYFDIYNYGVLPLGMSGSEKTLELRLREGETDIIKAEFYRLDADRLRQDTDELKKYPLTVTSHTSTHITGTVTSVSGRQLLFTTIPYDRGWSVKIDGEKVKTRMVLGSLTGVYVPQGRHRIEFDYIPEGFIPGCCISAASLAAAVLFFRLLRRRRSGMLNPAGQWRSDAAAEPDEK
jgi:uncharacterized membrane protein YfhO